MKLGIVSDEIVPDFAEAVWHGKRWGIFDYEIRVLRTGRIPNIERDEFRSVLRTVEREGVRVSALSPGVFKIPLRETERVEKEIREVLPETFRLAEQLGTRLVIVFGFENYPGEPAEHRDRVVEIFGRVARMAQEHGFTIAVENEPNHWCDTATRTASILRDVNSPYLRSNWDLGNCFCSGETPYPDGWLAIRDFVVNVHIKDYRRKDGACECVLVGDGEIDYEGQLRALRQERPLHHVTLETHLTPFLQSSRICAHRLQTMLRRIR
ncbi:MAG: sugar phosphate isomerase/epimerase [candidate division KSB1 bacterium]|nr:sugar phosphate isomerase/epimerase [candidate division KSB1 bacterium]